MLASRMHGYPSSSDAHAPGKLYPGDRTNSYTFSFILNMCNKYINETQYLQEIRELHYIYMSGIPSSIL